MSSTTQRFDGRESDQLRPISIQYGIYEYAAGSVLFEMGKTKILCAVSMQNGVPSFMRGSGTGWLKAEYALLPASTTVRSQRESSLARKDGRSVEISRLISRSFRSVVDLTGFGERTIMLDCDVLQADGGTRTASITGSYLALRMAQEKWMRTKMIEKPLLKENITAVSVGVVNDQPLLDVNYQEDSAATADFNFIITQSDKIIEMQGGAEQSPLSWQVFEQVRSLARRGAQDLFSTCDQYKVPIKKSNDNQKEKKQSEHTPLFSLKNRQSLSSK